MDQSNSKRKHTSLPLLFQIHISIYLHNTVILIIMTTHCVYFGLTDHNHILFYNHFFITIIIIILSLLLFLRAL